MGHHVQVSGVDKHTAIHTLEVCMIVEPGDDEGRVVGVIPEPELGVGQQLEESGKVGTHSNLMGMSVSIVLSKFMLVDQGGG